MTDFLLELRCEEIPARMQLKASDDLARLFIEELAKSGLKAERITSFVTPRRLALIAHGLPLQTDAVSEERKGPRADAPAQALEGFLRSTGLTREQLVERTDAKGNAILFAVIEKPGRQTADVLAEAVPAIVRAFPWPKSMRWGDTSATTESLRWVRPLQGIVAILGEELVAIEVEGVTSGYATVGHRFHHPGEITIGGSGDYAEKLRACHVIVSHAERQAIIAEQAAALATARGYSLIEDKGLVIENAGLTEWPVPLLGDFDPAFLDVPPEVIQLTLRINQKYFVLNGADGKLAPAFICTANIEAKDGGAAIVAGNGKVLAARLSDARFFWEQDKKTTLADHAQKLGRITFHEKLGTVADKVERVAKLARWLVEEGIVKGASADDAELAARLAKADLVTEMVGEFPELQGLMGGYYARAEGLSDAVADAVRDHYKPVGQGDAVPTAPVTVAVSLADKLDTLFWLWFSGQKPTGSKDPFALRRAAIAIIGLLQGHAIRLPVKLAFAATLACRLAKSANPASSIKSDQPSAVTSSIFEIIRRGGHLRLSNTLEKWHWSDDLEQETKTTTSFSIDLSANQKELLDFFADRLKVQQKEAGVRHDLIDAVFALGGEDDLVRLLARVKALQAFVSTEDGANLLAGYKRAANILKKEGWEPQRPPMAAHGTQGIAQTGEEDPLSLVEDPVIAGAVSDLSVTAPARYEREAQEVALADALDAAEPAVESALAQEDFAAAMAALASLRAPIDAFFDKVTVNDADQNKRGSRLTQLTRIRAAMHKVADFSRIEG
ncbi:glycine--tRNA ligase subunit beta [Sphingobium sufflavum]|uniref:glycine--tRNA ligase subunit beta n=1 Tax=Sphingobium sufflavum TaxID=1129547 RepID=UPI001F196AE4|nr:glycine--tRNA ligase subunit beta [Sphingobium sufflavum]MCE7797935.1 glycine--tRNA ligase subunit beta [Sphingobium sufflavum]